MKYSLYILIFFLIFNSSSAQLIHDFKVNDDTALSIIRHEANISTNKSGLSVIVWNEYILGNIYAQIYDKNFIKINNNLRVNMLLDSNWYPNISVREDGYFGIVWQKINGNVSNRCFTLFKLLNKDGIPITSDIQLNDTLRDFSGYPRIGCDSSGRFIVVWEYTQYDIYFQILDSIGNKIGNNKKANEGNTSRGKPDILVRKDGSFIIVWEDRRSTVISNIYMQMFDRNGNPTGINQRVNDDTLSDDSQYDPKISGDSLGNFTIAFNEYILNYNWSYIRYQRYDENGVKLGQNKSLPPMANEMLMTSFDSDEEGNLIFQMNRSNASNYFVYNIRIDKNNNPIGIYFPVSNEYIESGKGGEDIKLHNKRIINVWRDIRLSPQPQIFANVRSFINPDSTVGIIKISSEVPKEFKLYQNYPNPFNPNTIIRYKIPRLSSHDALTRDLVLLRVYNILGKEIITLVNEKQSPGIYEVSFEGNNFSTGIYFYRIQSGNFVQVKKMMLIK
jgi:hypothetical protein